MERGIWKKISNYNILDSALLTEKIEIYSVPTITNDYGTSKDGTPEYVCSTKAHVIFNSENRVVSEGEVYYPQDRTFVVRHYVPVEEKNLIKWDGKFYRILSINPNKYYNNKEIQAIEKNE